MNIYIVNISHKIIPLKPLSKYIVVNAFIIPLLANEVSFLANIILVFATSSGVVRDAAIPPV